MKQYHGFTLIELLISLAVIIITSTIFVNSLYELRKSLEAYATITRLEHFLKTSKTNALLNHQSLTICGSSGTYCDNQWSKGLLLLKDNNRNGVVEENDQVLSYVPLNLTTATLNWQGFGGSRITISHTGTTFASNGTFYYCPIEADSRYIRQIVINRGGRVRSSQDRNGDGIHENGRGVPLSSCP